MLLRDSEKLEVRMFYELSKLTSLKWREERDGVAKQDFRGPTIEHTEGLQEVARIRQFDVVQGHPCQPDGWCGG
jgi:hypothetical protein